MPQLGYGRRLKKNLKTPKLAGAKPKLRDRIMGFARRIRLARKSKTVEERERLFNEMTTAIKEDKAAFTKSIEGIISQESTRIQGSAPVDAMFGFMKGAKRGVIPKTERAAALEKKIKEFSDSLAFELEKANVSPTLEQEKRAYTLIDLLAHKGNPKPDEATAKNLLTQKREIDRSIEDFIQEHQGNE